MSNNKHRQNLERHDCTSKRLLLPDEKAEDWEALLADLRDEYGPETAVDYQLVYEAARSVWVLDRNSRRYDEIEQKLHEEQRDSTLWTEEQWRRLELRIRYRTTAERSWMRALRGLEHVRRNRASEDVARARRAKLEAETKVIEGAKAAEPRAEPKAEPKKERAPSSLGMPTLEPHALHQRIVVSIVENQTAVRGYPANDQIAKMAEGADPRAQVVRTFEFPNGVPAEYQWAGERAAWRISLARWRKLVEIEKSRDTEVFLDPRIVEE